MTISVPRCPICTQKGKPQENNRDKCENCGTIYQNPRLSDTALKEYYRSGKYHQEFPGDLGWEEKRADRIVQTIERLKINPKSCLDVGSGAGLLLKHLEIYNFARILGLEYNTEVSEIDEVVNSKEQVEGTFDLVTCIHTLEHMPNPSAEIEWMVSKLNDGGTLFLEVPTYEDNSTPHLFTFSREGLEFMLKDYTFAYLEDVYSSIVLVGDRYADVTAERVHFTADSPDFSTVQEHAQWLSQQY